MYEPTSRTPLYRSYARQKVQARDRSIPWHLSFQAWVRIWEESGHIEERWGGQWTLVRIDEALPYAHDNVRIVQRWVNAKAKRPRRTPVSLDPLSTDERSEWATKCIEDDARFQDAMRLAHPGREYTSLQFGTERPKTLPRPLTVVPRGEGWNWP